MMWDLNLLFLTQSHAQPFPVPHTNAHQHLYGDVDSPSIQCNNDSSQLQSLSEDLVNFGNVLNPNISSDEASTKANDDQSDPEVLENGNIPDVLLDLSCEVASLRSVTPLLPTLSPQSPL